MCQMSIILVEDGKEEVFLENASLLEVTDAGVKVSALFEEPKFIPGAAVRTIDFLHGTVTVTKIQGAS